MPGIEMSLMTTSKNRSLNRATAAAPSWTASTSYPAATSRRDSARVSCGSSSTSRTTPRTGASALMSGSCNESVAEMLIELFIGCTGAVIEPRSNPIAYPTCATSGRGRRPVVVTIDRAQTAPGTW